MGVGEKIWNRKFPTAISIFSWKLAHKGLSTDDRIRDCCIPLTSKCECCDEGNMESIDHLFATGKIASLLWNRLSEHLGLKWHHSVPSIKEVLRFFWAHKTKGGSLDSFLCLFLPLATCWAIWIHRCQSRFEGKKMDHKIIWRHILRVARAVVAGHHFLADDETEQIITDIFRLHKISFRQQFFSSCYNSWQPPIHGWKCNIAVHKERNGTFSAVGAITRGSEGQILFGLSAPIIASSHEDALMTGSLIALETAKQRNIYIRILECDMKNCEDWAKEPSPNCPWTLLARLQEIKRLMDEMATVWNYIPHEVNSTAKALAEYGTGLISPYVFGRLRDMPPMARCFVVRDRDGPPYFCKRQVRLGDT